MLNVNTSDIAVITIRIVDYRWIIRNIGKSERINLLENSSLENQDLVTFAKEILNRKLHFM